MSFFSLMFPVPALPITGLELLANLPIFNHSFHSFFQQLDNFRTDYFLWVTAGGIESSYQRTDRGGDRIPKALEAELGDEADGVQEGDD